MEERSYHHGNLREALIAAASKQIEQIGFEALSLRDLAASLDVSRAAPYRHLPIVGSYSPQSLPTDSRISRVPLWLRWPNSGHGPRGSLRERVHTSPSRRDALNCFG